MAEHKASQSPQIGSVIPACKYVSWYHYRIGRNPLKSGQSFRQTAATPRHAACGSRNPLKSGQSFRPFMLSHLTVGSLCRNPLKSGQSFRLTMRSTRQPIPSCRNPLKSGQSFRRSSGEGHSPALDSRRNPLKSGQSFRLIENALTNAMATVAIPSNRVSHSGAERK